jgi:flagellar protein FliL
MADVEDKKNKVKEAPKEKGKDADEAVETKKAFTLNPIVLIAIIGAMFLLSLVAFVIVFKVLTAPPPAPQEDVKKAEVKKEGGKKEGADKAVDAGLEINMGKIFTFENPIIVNLAESQGQRYLKTSVQLEVSDEKVLEELKLRTPQILDLLNTILSSKTVVDVESTVGRNRLRREIIDRINAEIVSGKINNVYFTEFVIQ